MLKSEIISSFGLPIQIKKNLIFLSSDSKHLNQQQTNEVFSDKWTQIKEKDETQPFEEFQKKWYLNLYGFSSESDFKNFLKNKHFIFDAGCGLGYKAAWFAKLAPHAKVLAMDYSTAAEIAAKRYEDIPNLFFIRGDIADTNINANTFDYISCDQVIMHTENPENTFSHLSSLLKESGEFSCYVYAKKALPRELLDDYFRSNTHNIPSEKLWEMSSQLTELGKTLSDLKININVPDIPLLGIKGGEYDLQRFIYWNFIKCFWNPQWGKKLSDSTNFDWYSPSNAKRYTEEEFRKMILDNHLRILYFHKEEACFSGRFLK